MTVADIIREARTNFGELEALTLSDDAFIDWINTSLDTVYALLPEGELIPELAETHSVQLSGGKGDLPADLDSLLAVRVGTVPATEVPHELIERLDRDPDYAKSLLTVHVGNVAATEVSRSSIDRMDRNPFLAPLGPVYATDGRTLWVRDDDAASVASAEVALRRPSPLPPMSEDPTEEQWPPGVIASETVSISQGKGELPTDLPFGPVFYTEGLHVWVRGLDGSVPSDADLTIIRPPAHVSEPGDEPALAKWHPAIVLFVTARAYGQEEDQRQAMHYRNEALAILGRGNPEVPEQESVEVPQEVR